MRKYFKYIGLTVAVITIAGVAWAAFSDKGKVLGSTFSVGSSDIKLMQDLGGDMIEANLRDELAGPNFTDIVPNWSQDHALKIYNNGSTDLWLSSNSNYETINDPDDLRSYIFVEPIEWLDSVNNGIVEENELGVSYGKKSIVKWKTEGFDLGTVARGTAKGFILRFSADSLSNTKQGKSAIYDFEFDAIQP